GQFRSRLDQKARDRKNLTLIRESARFLAPDRISVGNQELQSNKIFINAGARPAVPHVDGIDGVGYLTNATLMQVKAIPEHLLILGGGYIGLEFGQMFRRFGSKVTVVHNGPQILPREDADVVTELHKALEGEGIRFVLEAETKRAERKNGRI